ncbi:MAG TPA: serine hydrolase [Verrucomicrobiae bacterium]|nr:serine hydrolase [Verrucomicrobiae bacterium]
MASTRRTFLKHASLGTLGLWIPKGIAETTTSTTGGLPRSTPEAQGVSSAGILAFLDAMEKDPFELHGLMMLRHGNVIAEGWWAPYAPQLNHTMYSLSKSFTSTAVGFAVAEGKLSTGDRVISFFPDHLPEVVDDNLAALRVKDLLTMSVGNEKEPTQAVTKEENWVRAFLAQKISHRPGSVFMYNSAATYMCSAIVQKVTGQKIIDFLKPRLFEPLAITGMTWETCPRGINTGGWGLSIGTEALAKFGQFYLQKGQWNGRQILPASWIEEATTFKIQQPGGDRPDRPKSQNDWLQGYGYQFWRCQHGAFRGDGAFGQFTIVLPQQDGVIVMTGENKNMQGEIDLVWRHLLPAFQSGPLRPDAAAASDLQQRLRSLKLAPPRGSATSPNLARINGRAFKLETNDIGLTATSIAFSSDTCAFTAHADQVPHVITCGMGHWELGETSIPGTPPRLIAGGKPEGKITSKIAASATWTDENTLVMTWRYHETPHHDTVTCVLDGDQITVRFLSSIAAMGAKPNDARPSLKGRITA